MFSVLFVDDEPDLLEVAKLHLEKSGTFSVDTCNSAFRALRAVEKNHYDAIIADYSMPVMSGLDLLRELKSKGNTVPFIMLTHVDRDNIVKDSLNSGAMFFLRKGSDPDAPFGELKQKLHHAVRKKNSDRNRQLFSAISRHDLLNRLSAMFGYVELVKAHTDDTTILEYMQKQQIILATIRDQIRFIEDYEQIGINDPFWQSPSRLIREASSHLPADSVAISIEGIDSVEILADPLAGRVFYNLLDNSLRHGEHVSRIQITGTIAGDSFLITWEDNGAGIPDTQKEEIFLRGKGKNSGLGLFLIREILAITGITIRETGMAGAGAKFEILIPPDRFRKF